MSEMFLKTSVALRERLYLFLWNDEGGERDTLTTLLILALIIIPLVLIVIAFGQDIQDKAQEAWDSVVGGGL